MAILQDIALTVLSAVFMVVTCAVIIALYAALLALPGALLLRMACSLLGEPNVVYRRALAISGKAFAAQLLVIVGVAMISMLLDFEVSPYGAGMAGLLCLGVAAQIYSRMLPLRFARALAVALTQLFILSLGALVAVLYAEFSGQLEPLLFPLSWTEVGYA